MDVLDHLNTDDFEDIMMKLQTGYEKGGKIYMDDNPARARKLASIRALYKYLMGKGLIANNAAAMFPSPKLITKPITYLKDEEITLLLDTIKTGGGLTKHQQAFSDKQKTRDMAMIYLMLSTGIRISECVGLDIQDIDWEENSILVVRKGRKYSNIYFDETAAELLGAYMEEREEMELESDNNALLFPATEPALLHGLCNVWLRNMLRLRYRASILHLISCGAPCDRCLQLHRGHLSGAERAGAQISEHDRALCGYQ